MRGKKGKKKGHGVPGEVVLGQVASKGEKVLQQVTLLQVNKGKVTVPR